MFRKKPLGKTSRVLNCALFVFLILATFATTTLAAGPEDDFYGTEVECGSGYENCKRACQITVGIGVGVAMFLGIAIVIGNDGDASHCGH